MKNFDKICVSKTIKSSILNISVNIVKFKKTGTSQFFFAPVVNDLRINSTMFARMYDAEKLAVAYINHKSKN